MRKNKLVKIFSVMFVCLLLICSIGGIVYATAGDGFDASVIPSMSTINGKIKTTGNNITKTVFTVLQIAAFAGIIVAGLKYMFSSADQRADIKKSMIYVVTGMSLVFGASTVAKFAQESFAQVATSGTEIGESKTIYINGQKYTYTEYETKDKCDNKKITKKVLMGGNYVYCNGEGQCCSLVNGKYQIAAAKITSLSDDKTSSEPKSKEVTINIPNPSKYKRSDVYCGASWTYTGGNTTANITAFLTVYPDNTGTVYISTAGDLEYYLNNGTIYLKTTTCPGATPVAVYTSDKLLYKNL